jgi:hypothetical protein
MGSAVAVGAGNSVATATDSVSLPDGSAVSAGVQPAKIKLKIQRIMRIDNDFFFMMFLSFQLRV